MIKVFIDGGAGTTGLRIVERMRARKDVTLITLDEEHRKDPVSRKEAIHAADAVFLCLPDDAAKEAALLAEGAKAVVIDASTAHRTAEGWAYGFPELSPSHRKTVQSSKRIANPGCYASGFISLVYPLIAHGIAAKDYPFVCHAVSGYTGAGKKGIAEYEAEERDRALDSPRLYALGLHHKHLPEMQKVCALSHPPVFTPYICDFPCGMTVHVPLYRSMLQKKLTVGEMEEVFREHYAGCRFVKVAKEESGFLAANTLEGTNLLQVFVNGNDEQLLLSARLDNLGKGASGAAVQNMNIALGLDEGLSL